MTLAEGEVRAVLSRPEAERRPALSSWMDCKMWEKESVREDWKR